MKRLSRTLAGIAGLLLTLAACSDNNSGYPKEYVGFEKSSLNYSFDKSKETEVFNVKIIAAEKNNEDREVLVNGVNKPGATAFFKIKEKKVIIPAKKKSATLQVTIFPKRIAGKADFRIVCDPKSKDGKKTQIIVHLSPK